MSQRARVVSVLAAFALCATSDAAMIVGAFSGRITSVSGGVASATEYGILPEVTPAVGDSFEGTFVYIGNPVYDYRIVGDGVFALRFSLKGVANNYALSDGYVALFADSPEFGRLKPFSFEVDGGGSVVLSLTNPSEPFPTDGLLDRTWTEKDFGDRVFKASSWFGDLSYEGRVDFVAMRVAPEPSTFATAIVCGLCVGIRRLRRRCGRPEWLR